MSSFKESWKKTPKWVRVVCYILLGILAVTAFGFVIVLLWNWLMPGIFGLPVINFWEGMGIFILARIIFGFGFGSSKSNSGSSKKEDACAQNETGKDEQYYSEWWEAEGKNTFEKYASSKKNTGRPD